MGRGTWWAAVHGVAESQTRLSDSTAARPALTSMLVDLNVNRVFTPPARGRVRVSCDVCGDRQVDADSLFRNTCLSSSYLVPSCVPDTEINSETA